MTTSQLFNLTDEDIISMIDWAFSVINDLKILWLAIIGILLGLTVFVIILRAIRGKE